MSCINDAKFYKIAMKIDINQNKNKGTLNLN